MGKYKAGDVDKASSGDDIWTAGIDVKLSASDQQELLAALQQHEAGTDLKMKFIHELDLNRFHQCESAWYAIWDLLKKIDPEFSRFPHLTGVQCAVKKIEELAVDAGEWTTVTYPDSPRDDPF